MNLISVAKHFDRTPMWDAYTGRLLKARCQVTVWDSPRRDGLTTIRRTLSMAYGAKLPERHTVIIAGEVWIIARTLAPDTFGGKTTRVGYIAQLARLGKVGRTADVLGETAQEVYLSRTWVKDTKDIVNTSESQGQYYIYFTQGEPVEQGQFLFVDGLWHICKNILTGTAGLMIAECNELEPDSIVQVQLVSAGGVWNPVTEQYEQAEAQDLKVIMLDWRDDYLHELPSSEKEEVGDIRMRVQSEDKHLIKMDSRVHYREKVWQVVSIENRADDSVSVALRQVG